MQQAHVERRSKLIRVQCLTHRRLPSTSRSGGAPGRSADSSTAIRPRHALQAALDWDYRELPRALNFEMYLHS